MSDRNKTRFIHLRVALLLIVSSRSVRYSYRSRPGKVMNPSCRNWNNGVRRRSSSAQRCLNWSTKSTQMVRNNRRSLPFLTENACPSWEAGPAHAAHCSLAEPEGCCGNSFKQSRRVVTMHIERKYTYVASVLYPACSINARSWFCIQNVAYSSYSLLIGPLQDLVTWPTHP